MPTNTLAAADVPTGPVTPSERCSTQPMPRDDLLQHAPVIEQLGQRADHQDQRQRLEGQDEAGLGPHRVEGRRAAGQIAEHEAHAGAGGRLQRGHEARRPNRRPRARPARSASRRRSATCRPMPPIRMRASRAGAIAPRRSDSAQAISGMAKRPMRLCACSVMFRRPRCADRLGYPTLLGEAACRRQCLGGRGRRLRGLTMRRPRCSRLGPGYTRLYSMIPAVRRRTPSPSSLPTT